MNSITGDLINYVEKSKNIQSNWINVYIWGTAIVHMRTADWILCHLNKSIPKRPGIPAKTGMFFYGQFSCIRDQKPLLHEALHEVKLVNPDSWPKKTSGTMVVALFSRQFKTFSKNHQATTSKIIRIIMYVASTNNGLDRHRQWKRVNLLVFVCLIILYFLPWIHLTH